MRCFMSWTQECYTKLTGHWTVSVGNLNFDRFVLEMFERLGEDSWSVIVVLNGPKHDQVESWFFNTNQTQMVRWLWDWRKCILFMTGADIRHFVFFANAEHTLTNCQLFFLPSAHYSCSTVFIQLSESKQDFSSILIQFLLVYSSQPRLQTYVYLLRNKEQVER